MHFSRKQMVTTIVTAISALLLSSCVVQIPDAGAAEQDASAQEGGLFSVPAVEISAEMPYETQFVEVLGSQMAYVEAGEGDPILFLHGNPTSKYLWRNVMPWLEGQGRVIALDLIGMGESDKPDIGYTFAEHSEYVDGFISELGLANITLVIHDWGSGLGFDYAHRNPENVKGIAFMEAIIAPGMPASFETMPPELAEFFGAMRTEGVGEEMILNQNMFVEQVLPSSVVRGLTEAEMDVYRAPYPDAESRKPVLVWPRQVPISGEPADVVERVNAYNEWLLTDSADLPKLHIYVSPGGLNPPEMVAFLQQNMSNYEAVYVGQGLHFIQEDHPEAIGRAISDWYRRNGLEASAATQGADNNADEAGPKFTLITLVTMNEGYGLEERLAYEAFVDPIATKYDARRKHSYDIVQHLGGGIPETIRLNLWEIDDPSALEAIATDPTYVEQIPHRDEIHNMETLTLFMADEVLDSGPSDPDKFILVDLAIMNEGYGLEERLEYEEFVQGIAEQYGARVTHAYNVMQHLGGGIPETIRLNLWELDDPSALEAITTDPAYVERIPYRDEIHNMETLTLFLAKAGATAE